MTDFIVHVIDPKNPDKGFRHEFLAHDHADALAQTWSKLAEAYEAEKCKEEKEIIMVFLLLNFDVPPKAWKLKLPSKEVVECDVPCCQCGGYGGVDSGGSDPQGHPIMVECPSCSKPKPDVPASYSEIIGDMDKSTNHRPECRCDRCYTDLIHRASRGTEAESFKQALNTLQDSVWGSLDKYSKALGWGLTGIQPECWSCLDSAVEELRKRRQNDAQLLRIIERLHCRCLSLDCTKHGSYLPDDIATFEHILKTKTLV